jgi:hypothetical protein
MTISISPREEVSTGPIHKRFPFSPETLRNIEAFGKELEETHEAFEWTYAQVDLDTLILYGHLRRLDGTESPVRVHARGLAGTFSPRCGDFARLIYDLLGK